MGGKLNIRHIEMVANTASGSVSAEAPDEAREILAEFGVRARVCTPENGQLLQCVQSAVDAGPDLLVILAGDGTARCAAEIAGMDGPVVAPLPGGTMNMLPRAVYGTTDWKKALREALDTGSPRAIGGGQVEGHTFLVGAILGSPALWAPAREAVREGHIIDAFKHARAAYRRAFSGRLRVSLDGGERRKVEAVSFLCPMASKALSDDEQVLEAAVLDLSGAGDVVRLGFHAVVGDWRDDPAVDSVKCKRARTWAASGIPALLDGEPVRLKPSAEVVWRPSVTRVLAPPEEHGV